MSGRREPIIVRRTESGPRVSYSRRMRIGISFAVLSLTVAGGACVGTDPVTPSDRADIDASTGRADGATPPGAASPGDAASDAPPAGDAARQADAATVDFCQSPAAAGASFCVDFQAGADVAAGWDATTVASGATVTRNDSFGSNSTRSATVKLGGTTSAQGTLSKTVSAGALKSQVNIQYDAYFVFPAWPANAFNGFVTGITRTTALGINSQHYFDLERQPSDWKVTAGNGTPKAALSTPLTPNAWHHIDMTYDASGVEAAVRLTVDGVLVSSLSLVKGPPPAAPATFDAVVVNAGAENMGAAVTMTELTFDNVVVRFP